MSGHQETHNLPQSALQKHICSNISYRAPTRCTQLFLYITISTSVNHSWSVQ